MTISAKVICDSLSPSGVRLTTMELNYHRFIHSEFMTHRMFSRNASSSRAIPVEKMIKQVMNSPAMPIHWGRNQSGMQAVEECNNTVEMNWDYYNDCSVVGSREQAWEEAAGGAARTAHSFRFAGYHKQIVNRLLEPFQWIKVIVTATEWDNFFKLRLHKDAQPEMCLLAACMADTLDESTPLELLPGEWHLPYVEYEEFLSENECYIEMDKAIKCSVARCARVSYANHDNSTPDIGKDIALADRLLEAGHMSPFEHCATPMRQDSFNVHSEEGITHIDKYDNLWSGNFRGWIQHRQLISAV